MPRQIALVTNPVSGKGRATRAAAVVLARLREAGLSVRSLVGRDAGETLAMAHDAVASGADSVVVVGGDGMVHLAAQALAAVPAGTASLGVVPCGTGNDVARSLDIPRGDPVAAADVVVRGRTRRIDLARAGTSYVVSVVAAGFDSIVNERANALSWPRGPMRYHLATLLELRTLGPLPYRLELDGVPREVDAVLVAVGNGPMFGGGLRIAHGAVLDDGLLDVVVMHPMTRTALVRAYPSLRTGAHTRHPAYEHHRVRRVRIDAPGVVAYADGERVAPLPLSVDVVPAALDVLVPHG